MHTRGWHKCKTLHSRFWPLWPQTGNCQLWPFWQLHIETLDSEPRQGPVWQLPVWPQLAIVIGAQSGCHIVIYGYLLLFYFLYKNEMIRWFPCGTLHHSGSFIVMMYGDVQLVSFFLFVTFIKIICFGTTVFRWFHVVLVVFGSFMLTC